MYCLGRNSKEDNKILHTPKNKYVRDFMRKTIHGGRVNSCDQKFISKYFHEVLSILEKNYSKKLEISELFVKNFEHINAIKTNMKKKESRFSNYRRIYISKFDEYVDNKVAALPISKEVSMIDKSDLFVSSDYSSLNISAMAHKDSRWPKLETAKAINQNDSKRVCSSFNYKSWGRIK